MDYQAIEKVVLDFYDNVKGKTVFSLKDFYNRIEKACIEEEIDFSLSQRDFKKKVVQPMVEEGKLAYYSSGSSSYIGTIEGVDLINKRASLEGKV